MPVRIAVAAVNFGATFPGMMYARLRRHLRADQSFVECATTSTAAVDVARARLTRLLDGEPKPIAFIGISVRPDPRSLAAFRAAKVPVVLIDEEAEGATTVACDNYLGGVLAAAHLTEQGRRRIAIVVGKLNAEGDMNSALRLDGFEKALSEQGLAPVEVIYSIDYSRKDGVTAMTRLLGGRRGVDAIFSAAGDICATGMLAVARERGVRVPEDVAIVGFDDLDVAATSDPPLTTIRQPVDAMADEAFRLATEEREELLARPRRVILKPELVARQSA
ncbi:MAG TPA: substrate-binding domain-containing protein [Anaeromyxobacter sp.]|nr:substrate-binding domain-containing protein [Anaeromyxobacter sp.]